MRGFVRRRLAECASLVQCLIRHWPITGAILLIYALAQHWLMVNWTPSLPYRLVWIEYGRLPGRGDLMVYRFTGKPLPRYGYVAGVRFFKRVGGIAGEAIRVDGRNVFVGDRPIGTAKPTTHDGQRLDPIAAGTIPAGYYFAQSDSLDSFDSRYAQSGLVAADAVVGVAHVIF
jgi:conjugal transfer pilin signal peptidase TrbI